MATFQFFMVVIILLCIILTLVVLSQNPKGGGLSSTFGGSGGGQMFGVQRTNNFLDKATWTLFTSIILLIIGSNILQENPRATRIKQIEPIEQSAPQDGLPINELPDTTNEK